MRIDKDSWLLTKPIAHRGLWGESVPENSTLAYERAAEKKIPIEIDIHLTSDGNLVSFHDDNLLRMTGKDSLIWNKSLSELKALRLNGTNYTIPTLNEVLEIAKGKSPILVEFKNQPSKEFLEKAINVLKEYKGEFAVQSFNPFYIIKTKKLAPHFIRGVLTDPNTEITKKTTRWAISKMPFNFLAKPDFISCNFNSLPLPQKKVKDKALLAWTLTSKEDYEKIKDKCDNIIYELFTPTL
ncbi:MAG: glycerophosphodiester phosphodiesterase [Clostridia bacterium]|nr:glycerophosphodiester phosphodiesterase [Clostridia bacterium]